VRRQAEEAVLQLQKATSDFEAANEAFKQVVEVKSLVAEILSAMRQYYDAMVVEPMHDMGLYSEPDNSPSLDSEEEKRSEVEEIRGFFSDMNKTCNSAEQSMGLSEKNLTILCNFQSLEDATAEIVAAVDVKRKEVKRVVDELIDRQRHYWKHYEWGLGDSANCTGQMSDECETWLQEVKSEPVGLRKVVGIFQETGFYKQYLKRWRFDDADSFLTLSTEFQVSLARANQSAEKFKEDSANFAKALEEADEAAQNADKQLERALKIQSNKTASLAVATQVLNEAKVVQKKQRLHFADMKKVFDEAENQFKKARDHYMNTAKTSFEASFLQFLGEVVSPRAQVAHDATRLVSQTVAIRPHGLVQSFSLPGK